MSDPKPLKFARVEQPGDTPEWIEAAEQAAKAGVSPLALPQVAVDSINEASDSGDNVQADDHQVMQWLAGAANINAGERQLDRAGQSVPPEVPDETVVPQAPEQPELPAYDPELETQLRHSVQQFVAGAVELAVAKREVVTNVERDLLALSIKIAETIIGREVAEDPELHLNLVRAALATVQDATKVDLKVGSAAYEVIREHFDGDQFEAEGVEVRLVHHPELSELGCLVDTGSHRIDGRVAQRLVSVRRAFEEERLRRQAEGGSE